MSRRDDRVSLRHMLDHARETVDMARTRSRADLDIDRMFGLAMTRLLEIVGEAAARVSAPTKERIPNVPWAEVVGLRNRIVHGYDVVDFDIVWDTVKMDLPPLIAMIEAYLVHTVTPPKGE